MKKIVKTILLGCLVILPLFALSACSGKPIPKKRKSKLVLMQPLFLWDMRKRMVAMLVLILILQLQSLNCMVSMSNGRLLTGI